MPKGHKYSRDQGRENEAEVKQSSLDQEFESAIKSEKPTPVFWFESVMINGLSGQKNFIKPRQPGATPSSQRFPRIEFPPRKKGEDHPGRYPYLHIIGSKEIPYPETILTLLCEYRDNGILRGLLRFDAQEIVNSGLVPFIQVAEIMHVVHPAEEFVNEYGVVKPYEKGMRVMYPTWKDNLDQLQRKTVMSLVELRDTFSGEVPVVEERAELEIEKISQMSKVSVMTLASCMGMPPLSPSEEASAWRTALHSHIMSLSKQDYDKGKEAFLNLKKG